MTPDDAFTPEEIERLSQMQLTRGQVEQLQLEVAWLKEHDGAPPTWRDLGRLRGLSHERCRQVHCMLKRKAKYPSMARLRAAGAERAYLNHVLGMIAQVAEDRALQSNAINDEATRTRSRLRSRKVGLPVPTRAVINEICDLPNVMMLRLVAAIAGRGEPRVLKAVKVLKTLREPPKPHWMTAGVKFGPRAPAWIEHEQWLARERAKRMRRGYSEILRRAERLNAAVQDLRTERAIARAVLTPGLDWGV